MLNHNTSVSTKTIRQKLKHSYFIVIILLVLFTSHAVLAEDVTIIKEYTYRASDIDSKISSRAIALDQVKRLLLEELGTFLLSETEVKHYQISKDQITTLTAGIVMTSLVDEKWDGSNYYLKAKIVADPKEVEKSIDVLRKDKENSKELEAAKSQVKEALQEVGKLKKALASKKTNPDQRNDYDKAISNISAADLFYQGFSFLNAKNYKEAITTFSKAIELNSKSVEAYNNRALAYIYLGLYQNAFNDCNRALSLDSNNVKTYLLRGIVSEKLYLPTKRNISSYREGRFLASPSDAVEKEKERIIVSNYDHAIQIDPLNADAYYYKGTYYLNQSTKSKLETDYGAREGITSPKVIFYLDNETLDKCIENYKISAKLGNIKARDYLQKNGISW